MIGKVGVEVGKRVIEMRRRLRELIAYFGGKAVHPVLGLPGVSKGLAKEDWPRFQALAKDGLEFAQFTLQVFKDLVLKNPEYMKLITGEAYTHQTCYLGMVDGQNRVNFYDGQLRVVDVEEGADEVCAGAVFGLRGGACGAVELHEVHLLEAAGVEGFCGGAGDEPLRGGTVGAVERQRGFYDAVGAAGV
ncbi:hypothetical protein [Fontisphaera persica]|uniref:hypothetical protein n=1 Tax=Fontisphaera persica TaxID=2974023 RepID=UPI003CCCBFEF